MAIQATCLTISRLQRYRRVANAMSEGIQACGDRAAIREIGQSGPGTVGVGYGWKHRANLMKFSRFVYADLGFWQRDKYYRITANGWGPESYVRAGLPDTRFKALGLSIEPWRKGKEILIAGSSEKSCTQHGFRYMEWEAKTAQALKGCGYEVVYRPKPTDPNAKPLQGVRYDRRPLSEALASAHALVTHHSNTAIDALLAGVPVHCVTGAAAAFSVPLSQIANPPRLVGREQFLYDVAWLQWTEDEMRSGACWSHLKERGLVC